MPTDRRTEPELIADLLPEASARVVRTVDAFHDGDWSAPSLLPTWTRAHVVAHLALNSEGMARALRGVLGDALGDVDESGPETGVGTMYDSDAVRDSDIAELATAEHSEIRARLLAGVSVLHDVVSAVPSDQWETRLERTPGGRSIRAGAFLGMRWRELEIHHVDLDAGYAPSDWTQEFAEHLLDAMVKRVAAEAVEIRPLDSARTWVLGDGESEYPVPVVTGPIADIGWWLTGRPAPDTVSCSHGELPSIEGW
jgi:maleylpyruvate isomerase